MKKNTVKFLLIYFVATCIFFNLDVTDSYAVSTEIEASLEVPKETTKNKNETKKASKEEAEKKVKEARDKYLNLLKDDNIDPFSSDTESLKKEVFSF